MTTLFTAEFPHTLDHIVARIRAEVRPGERAEAWLFEGEAARRAAEQRLAKHGFAARLRSAYKPLVHAFLEEFGTGGLSAVSVALPSHPRAAPGRFALEAYPLAALARPASLELHAGTAPLEHIVQLAYLDGRRATVQVFAPNRERIDHLGKTVLSPCGWLRVGNPGAAPRIDEPVETEFEALFARGMAAIANHPFGTAEPYFERLTIAAEIPSLVRELACGDEVIDTREALHEEFYFSLLEHFQRRSGRPVGARDLVPGQIVPDVRASKGPARLRITLEALKVDHAGDWPDDPHIPLAALAAPVSPARIARELAGLGGESIRSRSAAGRPVEGRIVAGEGPAVVITGGQHANETSGVIGALRAAYALQAAGRSFAVIPLENPDGYALHHELRQANPRHMHHAARYTARGDDLGHRTKPDPYESAARRAAFARSGARLHINLHGYPAHEWTRPLTGYVPRGFGLWAVPKGFFLVVRHQPELAAPAAAFAEALTARLAGELPELVAFNAEQLRRYRAHIGAGREPFQVLHGIACEIGGPTRATAPFELITEFPDETIYGEAFRFAHAVQTATAIAATEIWSATPVA